jgi:hypothetical protein
MCIEDILEEIDQEEFIKQEELELIKNINIASSLGYNFNVFKNYIYGLLPKIEEDSLTKYYKCWLEELSINNNLTLENWSKTFFEETLY